MSELSDGNDEVQAALKGYVDGQRDLKEQERRLDVHEENVKGFGSMLAEMTEHHASMIRVRDAESREIANKELKLREQLHAAYEALELARAAAKKNREAEDGESERLEQELRKALGRDSDRIKKAAEQAAKKIYPSDGETKD